MWSLATSLLVSSAVGTGLSVYGDIKSGQAKAQAGKDAQAAANDQANLTDYNATVADQQAQDAIARGQVASDQFRTQVRGMIGSQRAGFAAGNVDVGSGSAVDVQSDAARLGEIDALQIKTNAAREAWGYSVQASDLRRQAEITRKTGVMAAAQGSQAADASYLQAGEAGLLGGVGLLSQRYGQGPKIAKLPD